MALDVVCAYSCHFLFLIHLQQIFSNHNFVHSFMQAKGINYLHRLNPPIVHWDLKSPNLLVDKNWTVKVTSHNKWIFHFGKKYSRVSYLWHVEYFNLVVIFQSSLVLLFWKSETTKTKSYFSILFVYSIAIVYVKYSLCKWQLKNE